VATGFHGALHTSDKRVVDEACAILYVAKITEDAYKEWIDQKLLAARKRNDLKLDGKPVKQDVVNNAISDSFRNMDG
jgi:hypothetical protein